MVSNGRDGCDERGRGAYAVCAALRVEAPPRGAGYAMVADAAGAGKRRRHGPGFPLRRGGGRGQRDDRGHSAIVPEDFERLLEQVKVQECDVLREITSADVGRVID